MAAAAAKSGKFITLEGCEGVGKTTQIKLLAGYFKKNNITAAFVREPGGTDISEQIRKLILYPANKMEPCTELLLYAAARSQLTAEVIKPAIESGIIVICDRYIDSTTAYQGYGRGIDLNIIKQINDIASLGINIDLTFFLDLDPVSGFKRKGGPDIADRLDSEGIAFHQRVYGGFKKIAAEEKRVTAIDACLPSDMVFDLIIKQMQIRKIL